MKITNLSIIIIASLLTVNCSKKNELSQNDSQAIQKIPIEDFFKKPQQSGYRLSSDGNVYIFRAPVMGNK